MRIPKNAEKVFDGQRVDVYEWDQELFDGSIARFQSIIRNPSVQIIAVVGDKIVLHKEEQPFRGEFLGMPGGEIEKGEDPKVAALRELKEETGMEPEELILWKIDKFGISIQWDSYYYIAKNCKKICEPQLDAGEKIEEYLVDFDQLFIETEKKDFRNKTFSNMLFRINHNKKDKEEFKDLLFN